jgi:hypothetical protein
VFPPVAVRPAGIGSVNAAVSCTGAAVAFASVIVIEA